MGVTERVHLPWGPLAQEGPHSPAFLGIPCYHEGQEIHAHPVINKTREQEIYIVITKLRLQ